MATFYATGKDDNIMYMSRSEGFGLGGAIGNFGLSVNASLSSGTYNPDVNTFALPSSILPDEFEISHIEVWGLGPETDANREKAKLHVRKPNLKMRGGEADLDDLMGQIS